MLFAPDSERAAVLLHFFHSFVFASWWKNANATETQLSRSDRWGGLMKNSQSIAGDEGLAEGGHSLAHRNSASGSDHWVETWAVILRLNQDLFLFNTRFLEKNCSSKTMTHAEWKQHRQTLRSFFFFFFKEKVSFSASCSHPVSVKLSMARRHWWGRLSCQVCYLQARPALSD